jgi:hypothetical protein
LCADADAIRWAERIMDEIDRRHPTKPSPQQAGSGNAAVRQKVEALWK